MSNSSNQDPLVSSDDEDSADSSFELIERSTSSTGQHSSELADTASEEVVDDGLPVVPGNVAAGQLQATAAEVVDVEAAASGALEDAASSSEAGAAVVIAAAHIEPIDVGPDHTHEAGDVAPDQPEDVLIDPLPQPSETKGAPTVEKKGGDGPKCAAAMKHSTKKKDASAYEMAQLYLKKQATFLERVNLHSTYDPGHVEMYALMHEAPSTRLDVAEWLTVANRYPDGAVEVCSYEVRIADKQRAEVDNNYIDVPDYVLQACCLVALGHYFGGSIKPLHLAALPLAAMLLNEGKPLLQELALAESEETTRDRFAHFFSIFSHIETLVLEGPYGEVTFAAVLETLVDVQINRLEVRSNDGVPHDQILLLCRQNKIHRVLVLVSWVQDVDFDVFVDFVRDLVAIGASLDIYEKELSQSLSLAVKEKQPANRFFSKKRGFWAEMVDELKADGIYMRLITESDLSFRQSNYPMNVRAHMRCETMDPRRNADVLTPLKPVPTSR